jgi:hypothetical protein
MVVEQIITEDGVLIDVTSHLWFNPNDLGGKNVVVTCGAFADSDSIHINQAREATAVEDLSCSRAVIHEENLFFHCNWRLEGESVELIESEVLCDGTSMDMRRNLADTSSATFRIAHEPEGNYSVTFRTINFCNVTINAGESKLLYTSFELHIHAFLCRLQCVAA